MTQDTRDYLNRYAEVLSREHSQYAQKFFLYMAVAGVALGFMVFAWWDHAIAVSSLAGLVFGYYMALVVKVHGRLNELTDELVNIHKRLENGNE